MWKSLDSYVRFNKLPCVTGSGIIYMLIWYKRVKMKRKVGGGTHLHPPHVAPFIVSS